MLKRLFEDDIADSAELTDTQKKVLIKIKIAATPKVAYEDVSKDVNDVAARDLLQKMNLIDIAGNAISLNDEGEQTLKDEGLTDETGNVIQSAKDKYLKDVDTDDSTPGALGGEPINPEPGMGGGMGAGPGMGESFNLIREINNQLKINNR